MNILIVDDFEQDRKMLRRTIHKKHPEYKISEVSNLSYMYAELTKPCELLFLDISLNGNNKPDNEGLNAICAIIDGYPGLPICLITGYFKEKVYRVLGDFMSESGPIVNCLDKGKYKSEDLLKVYSKAEKYRLEFEEKVKDKPAVEDLILEAIDAEKDRLEKQYLNNAQKQESRNNLLELMETAYNGRNWVSRIEAENNITGGTCQGNSFHLCVKIDKLSKFPCGNENQECTFRQRQECPFLQGQKCNFRLRTKKLSERYCLSDTTKKMLNDSWDIRNLIIHGSKIASCQDALSLLNVVELLQHLKQKQ